MKGYWKKSTYIKRGTRGYWSKWGGGVRLNEGTNEWMCQSCGRSMWLLPFFEFDIKGDAKLKLCSMCFHLSVINTVTDFDTLITITRVPDHLKTFANLATLTRQSI